MRKRVKKALAVAMTESWAYFFVLTAFVAVSIAWITFKGSLPLFENIHFNMKIVNAFWSIVAVLFFISMYRFLEERFSFEEEKSALGKNLLFFSLFGGIISMFLFFCLIFFEAVN